MSETPFWPKSISFQEVLISGLWAFIAWAVWSLFILLVMFVFWNYFNVSGIVLDENLGTATNSMFPFTLSLVSLIWVSISLFATYFILSLISPERYKRNSVISWQIAFFSVMSYLFITPVYIYTWLLSYTNIMFVFLGHTTLVCFWTSLLLEILNNYRYILTGLYGSFVWLFISVITTLLIFFSFSSGYAKLLSLLFLLPFINACMVLCKWLFELAYFRYHRYTNLDQLGDIFYQIEMEEKEKERTESTTSPNT